MLFKNLIFMFSVLSLCAGCTFYESGVKNKPELFTDIQNVPTYTSSYFGCATPVSNNKPLSSQGYKLFYDSNHELWLECRGAGYNEFFRAHMGPASFTKEDWSSNYAGGLNEYRKGYKQIDLKDCSYDELCGNATRSVMKFMYPSITMDKNATCGKKEMLCATSMNPRREIRMQLDGTNLQIEIADLDSLFQKYKKVINGSMSANQLKNDEVLPTRFAKEFENEIIENILFGTNINNNKALLAQIYGSKENDIDKTIVKITSKLSSTCNKKGLGEHAQDMNSVCVAYKLSQGANVNEIGESGYPPIFLAINGIKVHKKETEEFYRIVKMLILHGADLSYRDNPQPTVFLSPMNAKEFLTASRTDGIYSLPAPYAPKVLSLFSDKDIQSVNAQQTRYARRAEELGISKNDYLSKLSRVEELRKNNKFESYAEAFKLTGLKEDFVAAQKLAISRAQKEELEFLAILATRDKHRIFNIVTTLNEVKAQSVSDDSTSDRALFVFKINSKDSSTHFKGSSQIKLNKNSPFSINAAYKLTVKYTLTVPTEQTTTVNFIISNSTTRKEVIKRTETRTFLVGPQKPTVNTKLDFGKVTIARSSKTLGGIGKIKLELAGDPTITTEIVKVERVHG